MQKTGKIKLARTERLWRFPPLTDGKKGRVFTKHYTNLSFILNPNHFSLLSFLIFQAEHNNVVKYSNKILIMYQNAVNMAQEEYNSINGYLNTSPPKTRLYFKWLITEGFLIDLGGNKFLINPSLTYSKLYMSPADYEQWVERYQNPCPSGEYRSKFLAESYLEIVNKVYAKKHK